MTDNDDPTDPAEGSITGAGLLSLLAARGPAFSLDELDELEVTIAEQKRQRPELKFDGEQSD